MERIDAPRGANTSDLPRLCQDFFGPVATVLTTLADPDRSPDQMNLYVFLIHEGITTSQNRVVLKWHAAATPFFLGNAFTGELLESAESPLQVAERDINPVTGFD